MRQPAGRRSEPEQGGTRLDRQATYAFVSEPADGGTYISKRGIRVINGCPSSLVPINDPSATL